MEKIMYYFLEIDHIYYAVFPFCLLLTVFFHTLKNDKYQEFFLLMNTICIHDVYKEDRCEIRDIAGIKKH